MTSVSCLAMFSVDNKHKRRFSHDKLHTIVANTQTVTVLRSAEFDNVSMLQRVRTLTQNDNLVLDSNPRLLGEAQKRLLSPWMLQNDEHENYYAFFARLLIPSNGIHELSLSASLIRRFSFATSSGVESSKKSMKSSNIFLEIAEDGATMPRIFSSLMMVMDGLFMTGSVTPTKRKINGNAKPPIGMGGGDTTTSLI